MRLDNVNFIKTNFIKTLIEMLKCSCMYQLVLFKNIQRTLNNTIKSNNKLLIK